MGGNLAGTLLYEQNRSCMFYSTPSFKCNILVELHQGRYAHLKQSACKSFLRDVCNAWHNRRSRHVNFTLYSTKWYISITFFQWPMEEEHVLPTGIREVCTEGHFDGRVAVICKVQIALEMKQKHTCIITKSGIRGHAVDKATVPSRRSGYVKQWPAYAKR